MDMNPNDAAKKALIAYRQLSEMLKDGVRPPNVRANIESYNRILETLNQCFGIDQSFHDAVRHLKELSGSETIPLAHQMTADGKVLLATAHSFIELYLSPEDKKKTFGFHP